MVKMRKTVYPFAVLIALPLVIVVFIVLNQGHFEQVATTAILKNGQTTESYFTWKGIGTPQIKAVQLEDDEKRASVASYDTTKKEVMKSAPESAKKEMEQDPPNLSVQIDSIQSQQLDREPTITIRYTIYGINREQKINVAK